MKIVGFIIFTLGLIAAAWGEVGMLDRRSYSTDDRELFVIGIIAVLVGIFLVSQS